MKKLLFVLLLMPLSILFPQDKYFIYFIDKGSDAALLKSGLSYQKALATISTRSIERRKKVMDTDSLITFEDLPLDENYISQLTQIGIKIENKLKWFNAVTAYLDEAQKIRVDSLPFVKNTEPVRVLIFNDERIEKTALPKIVNSDQLDYGSSFDQLELSDVPAVHAKGITGQGIIIGILDTGFDWKYHESLKNSRVLNEYDFVFHDSVTADQSGDVPGQDSHGTFVFSVIGGYKDSALIGSAYGSSFILAKTENIASETHVEEDNYAAALEWMENLGVDVTSSSLGYNEFDSGTSYTYADMDGKTTIVTRAAELAFRRGVVTITSAGNEGTTNWHHILAPADGFNTIAVGAVYFDNLVASFSSRGPTYDGRIKPDVVTMGVDVFGASTNGTDLYTYGTGTSSAAPIAGGIAALLLSEYPHLTNKQVRSIFLETSDNAANPDNDRGYGLLSAAKAISFPNLQDLNGSYYIHKAFVDSFLVHNVQLHYSTDDMNFMVVNMNAQNDYTFNGPIPAFTLNQEVGFYFTYEDETGNSFRDPVDNNYKFQYGNLLVSLNIALSPPAGYVLSHNYPNPFNSYTTINFIADGNYPAELTIYDALGNRVKTLFKGISGIGTNHYTWNGTTDAGFSAASGIYIYTLNLNGNFYADKMVYLK
jgi:serine protease AprX